MNPKRAKLEEAFNFFMEKSNEEISVTVEVIGKEKLTPTSHLFKIYGPIPIKEAALKHSDKYSERARECPPLAIIDVTLAANREYNIMVEPVMSYYKKEMKENPSTAITFLKEKTLQSLLEYLKTNLQEFYINYVLTDINRGDGDECFTENEMKFIKEILRFREVNRKKLKMIFDVLNAFVTMKNGVELDDYEFLNNWATVLCEKGMYKKDGELNKTKLKKTALGREIYNLGVATIQHLRMNFGADTFKPDQRVKEVLLYKFLNLAEGEFSSNDLDDALAFKLMKRIKEATDNKYKMISLDSIFVNFGSGYFNRNNSVADVVEPVLRQLFRKLIEKGVNMEMLAEVSGYSTNKFMALVKENDCK